MRAHFLVGRLIKTQIGAFFSRIFPTFDSDYIVTNAQRYRVSFIGISVHFFIPEVTDHGTGS